MIKDPAKKVMTYNCKHIVFILPPIGFAAGNDLLDKHCVTNDDVHVIDNLQQGWVRKPFSGDMVPSKSHTVKTNNHITYKDFKLAKENVKDLPCEWSVEYYSRGSIKGRSQQCASSKKIMHYMEHRRLCFKCVFRT